jgi:hypothetical protein
MFFKIISELILSAVFCTIGFFAIHAIGYSDNLLVGYLLMYAFWFSVTVKWLFILEADLDDYLEKKVESSTKEDLFINLGLERFGYILGIFMPGMVIETILKGPTIPGHPAITVSIVIFIGLAYFVAMSKIKFPLSIYCLALAKRYFPEAPVFKEFFND